MLEVVVIAFVGAGFLASVKRYLNASRTRLERLDLPMTFRNVFSLPAEAAAKVIHADGALDKKLDALVQINQVWAEAYTKQRPTPDMVMGGAGGAEHNPAANFMQILTAKAAKDLQVDLTVQKQ